MRHLILSVIFGWVTAALAQSPMPDAVLGTRPGAFSARSLALGHALLTTESGPSALMGNPALLTAQEKRWRLDLSADVARVKETRKYPFYDSFDGVLGYNNYALNDHLYSSLDGGVAWRVPTKAVESLVLSAGSYSAYPFNYRYHEEVRARYMSGGVQDLKLGENRIDITGELRSVTLGAAARHEWPLSVGFSVSALMGEWTYKRGVYYTNPDSLNYLNRVEYQPDGTPVEMTFGAAYTVNPRVTVGLRALLPAGDFKFKQDAFIAHADTVTTNGTITATYPQRVALGVQYRPQSEFRPLLVFEGELITYSDVSDDYDDTFELRAGAEQQVMPGAPVRLGFVYGTSPRDKDRATSLFTAGIGFRLEKIAADFGVELGKINYVEDDLFPQSLYGDDDRIDKDRVETGLFRALITLRYEW